MKRNHKQLATGTRRMATNTSDIFQRAVLSHLAGLTFGGKRDLLTVLGYNAAPTHRDYVAQYEINGIAERVIEAHPNATWRTPPAVIDDADEDTPFARAWKDLEKRLKISRLLRRADCLDGLGRYSVILIGLSGQQDLAQPAAKGNLIYLQAYSEQDATITQWDTNASSPRFGLPLTYSINTGTEATARTLAVHWTRVIHVAEGCLRDDVYGKPRLRGIYNWLQDLIKCVGGSAEMYWRGAAPGLHFDIDKEQSAPTEEELTSLKAQIEDYVHGLARTIRTQGVNVHELGKTIQEPTGLFKALMQLVSGTTGIPMRILLGSERGELASTQDDENWKDRVAERQETHAGPMIVRPLVERLILFGALPQPKGGDFTVEWADLTALSEEKRADLAVKVAQALDAYTRGGAELICPPTEFRESVLGWDPEPAGGFPDLEEPLDETEPEDDPEPAEEGDPEPEPQDGPKPAAAVE